MTLPDGAQSGTRKDLANYRLQCAAQELKDTQLLIDADSFNSANNRSYYAIFHAINAIHALDGNGYKRHKDAIENFNRQYIMGEIFPREYGHKIALAVNARHKSDYTDYHRSTKEEAIAQLEFATEFVAAVKAYCDQRQ